MNDCARCRRREEFNQDYHFLCSECYETLANEGIATEKLVALYRAWRFFRDAYKGVDRDELKDFLECGTYWDFMRDSLSEADWDSVHDFMQKQIKRMAD